MSEEMNSQAAQLIKEAKEAIQNGDKAQARGKLEAAVKMEQQNEEAWLLLARVVGTDEERRTCLGNVLIINPQNPQALKLMEKLEGRSAISAASGASDSPAGGGRMSRPMMIGIAVVGLILVLLLIVVMGGGGGADALPTRFLTSTATFTPNVGGTETAQASITPTITISPTITRAAVSGVSTWTPTPAPTDTLAPIIYPPPPADVPGRIVMQSGWVASDPNNQPIVVVRPSDPSARRVISGENQRGQNPALDPQFERFIWTRFAADASGVSGYALSIQNFGIGSGISLTNFYNPAEPLTNINDADWFGNRVVFTASDFGSNNSNLWLFSFDNLQAPIAEVAFVTEDSYVVNNPSLTRLVGNAPVGGFSIPPAATVDGAATLDPAQPTIEPTVTVTPGAQANLLVHDPRFDPTGSVVIFVGEQNGVTELYAINLATQAIIPVTANGNSLVESSPDWGVYNGVQEVVFAATENDGTLSHIYVMPADASAAPQQLFEFNANVVKPRFSPDGRYVVFSTNRQNNWDVFIYDRQTNQFYTLIEESPSVDIASEWLP